MKFVRASLLAGVFLSTVGLIGCGKQAAWYDFGNGKINIDSVSVIRPVMEYTLTMSDDAIKDVGRDYSEPITDESVEKFISLLSKEQIEKQEYYRVKFNAYVMFDTFKLGLFESADYIKHPSNYSVNDYLISQAKKQGANENVIAAISTLNGKSFPTAEAFKNALAEIGTLNMDNPWVANVLPTLGVGEAGAKFAEQVKDVEADNLLGEDALSKLHSDIKSSLKSYKDIPAK